MTFCPEAYIRKFGWKPGNGLGQLEQGIKEPVKTLLKFDKTGVGHDPAKEFTDRWWEHQYNNAAKKISVKDKSAASGQAVKEEDKSEEKSKRSDKRKDKNRYKSFIKTAVYDQGFEHTDSASGTDNTEVKLPQPIDDETLLRICGGRTAHKAARHGHKMNGKLRRLQDQEAALQQPWATLSSEVTDVKESNKSLSECPAQEPQKKKKRTVEKHEDVSSELHDIGKANLQETLNNNCNELKIKKKRSKNKR